jgi:hypothetical protein
MVQSGLPPLDGKGRGGVGYSLRSEKLGAWAHPHP